MRSLEEKVESIKRKIQTRIVRWRKLVEDPDADYENTQIRKSILYGYDMSMRVIEEELRREQ